MVPDDKDKKKKPYRDFDEFISKIIEDFFSKPIVLPRIFEEFDRLMRELARELMAPPEMMEEMRPKVKRYTWGFSIVIPPYGPPKITQFGNVKPEISGEKVEVERKEEFEPLATVYEDDDTINVIVDLPGVDENSIKVDATDDKVIVRAVGEDRKYYKEIRLPKKVNPDSVQVSFKNGVLELKFKKK